MGVADGLVVPTPPPPPPVPEGIMPETFRVLVARTLVLPLPGTAPPEPPPQSHRRCCRRRRRRHCLYYCCCSTSVRETSSEVTQE
jgi:hypothetical protein